MIEITAKMRQHLTTIRLAVGHTERLGMHSRNIELIGQAEREVTALVERLEQELGIVQALEATARDN